jgi:hypothetical protein
MTNAVPKKYRIDLSTARDGKLITARGRIVRIVDASDAGAIIKIAVHENIPDRYESLSKTGKVKDDNGFEAIYISNDAQANKWVVLLISEGAYDVEVPVTNSVDSIINPVTVVTAPGTKIDVYDDLVRDRTNLINNNVIVIGNRLRNDKEMRSPLSVLTGASFAEATNATVVVVPSGSNVNGVLIRYAMLTGYHNNGTAWIKVGSNFLIKYNTLVTNAFGLTISHALRDIIIPSGVALEIGCASATNYVSMYYEVL